MKLSLKLSVFLFLIFVLRIAGQQLTTWMKQPLLKVEAGESVTIKCPYVPDTKVFSVHWTFGLEAEQLVNHQYYKNRTRVSESNLEIIISNLTEEDSGMYFCQVESGAKLSAGGAMLEVIRTPGPPEGPECPDGSTWLVMEILRIVSLIIILIILITFLIIATKKYV